MTREYDYLVWGTQGGGLARKVGLMYIFVEAPDCPGLNVGDEVPREWDLAPANEMAREDDEEPEDDGGGAARYPDAGSRWATGKDSL